MTTGIDWNAVRAELDGMDWEEVEDRFERHCFLGTVFRLYPSGKYYTPWACGNLNACDGCQGSGQRRLRRRLLKKWKARQERFNKLADKRGRGPNSWAHRHNRAWRYCHGRLAALTCQHCGGCGSREAYLDEQFSGALESEAEEHNLFITSGEGDPCDILAGECTDGVECDVCGQEYPEGLPHECDEELNDE
jgi:hypothetical protein